jgi:hypothetical protein
MADIEARQKAKRIAQERGLVGLANDTKWLEFFTQVMERQLALEVKIIYEEDVFQNHRVWSPSENYLEGSGMGPELFIFIEWVRSQSVNEIQAIATSVGLECELRDGKVVVYGYR